MILSRTPVRIEIGGGATDVEPYSTDYGGYVVNVTINNYMRSILNKRDDSLIRIFSNESFSSYMYETIKAISIEEARTDLIKAILHYEKPEIGVDIYLHGEPPKRAGLGASASLSTSLIAGILKLQDSPIEINKIAESAYHIEQDILKNEGGRQDQYASVFGGFNGLEFLGGFNVKVEKLKISDSFKKKIEKNLLLFYTGEPHVSGDMVKRQVDSYLTKKQESKSYLDKLKELSYQMRDSLLAENFEAFGNLLTEDWIVKTKFNPLLTTDYMRELNELVIKNGGIGGRVCGAGGGGCFFWLVSPDSREKIVCLLSQKSGKLVNYSFVEKGLEISHI